MAFQFVDMLPRPPDQILFAVVVRHQRDIHESSFGKEDNKERRPPPSLFRNGAGVPAKGYERRGRSQEKGFPWCPGYRHGPSTISQPFRSSAPSTHPRSKSPRRAFSVFARSRSWDCRAASYRLAASPDGDDDDAVAVPEEDVPGLHTLAAAHDGDVDFARAFAVWSARRKSRGIHGQRKTAQAIRIPDRAVDHNPGEFFGRGIPEHEFAHKGTPRFPHQTR